ncbi:MAG: endonuclease IV, partial [Candidatus Nitrosothermus koennekii]
ELDFAYKIYLNNEECKIVADIAEKLGVRLSIHAPYYINLLSEKESIVNASKKRTLTCIERAENLKADAIAVHAAFYGKLSKEEAYNRIKRELKDIIEYDTSNALAIETMAKSNQFGTLDEVLRLYEELGVKPYIDFAHIFARNNGMIDYASILDRLEDLGIKHINAHFEGLKYKNGKYIDMHTPINQPPFEPLAIELVNRRGSITIICESPLLELDCLKMKKILEEIGYKWE